MIKTDRAIRFNMIFKEIILESTEFVGSSLLWYHNSRYYFYSTSDCVYWYKWWYSLNHLVVPDKYIIISETMTEEYFADFYVFAGWLGLKQKSRFTHADIPSRQYIVTGVIFMTNSTPLVVYIRNPRSTYCVFCGGLGAIFREECDTACTYSLFYQEFHSSTHSAPYIPKVQYYFGYRICPIRVNMTVGSDDVKMVYDFTSR